MTVKAAGRMTADEVALLKEVVRWRRNHGVDYDFRGAAYKMADGRRIAWNTVSALHWPRAGEVGVYPCARRPLDWHQVESVTQAIDVLVALGYLPLRFSSAYRAGWEAAMVWEKCTDDDAVFARMFHDPANVSFPAAEVAW